MNANVLSPNFTCKFKDIQKITKLKKVKFFKDIKIDRYNPRILCFLRSKETKTR